MENNYYVNFESVSLNDYEKELKDAELIPSRMILKENLKERFSAIKKQGLKNLQDIMNALKNPKALTEFSKKTGIPMEYLTILKREIGSIQPKPVDLSDFQGIDKSIVQKLGKINIKNTKQLFDFVKTDKERKELSAKTGIEYKNILELTKLTDVCRIKWVGANFARLLADSECDTVKKVTKADYKKLYDEVIKINEEKKYFKGKFGLNDMKLCVIAAKSVPDAIKY